MEHKNIRIRKKKGHSGYCRESSMLLHHFMFVLMSIMSCWACSSRCNGRCLSLIINSVSKTPNVELVESCEQTVLASV